MSDVSVVVDRGLLIVRTPYGMREGAKATGARWDGRRKAWTLPATSSSAAAVDRELRGLLAERGAHVDAEYRALLAQAAHAVGAQAAKTRDDLPDIPTVKTSAWLHQRQAFHFAKDLPAALLDMHMGTGKTLTALGLVGHKASARTFVLAPKRIITSRVWSRGIEAHLDDPPVVLELGDGSTKKRAQALQEALNLQRITGRPLFVVVNYDAAWRPGLAEVLLGGEPTALIFDELHRIKAHDGKASGFAYELSKLPTVRSRLGLTGTLMPHGPLDLFAQLRALDAGVFGLSWHRFRLRYTVPDFFGGVKAYQNLDELQAKLAPLAYRATKDVLDLPPLMHEPVRVQLGAKAVAAYRALEDELYALLDEGEVTVENALTRLLRLQQVTSGHVMTDSGELVQVDTAKRDALKDLLGDLDEPVVVFCIYREDVRTIRAVVEELGRTSSELTGSEDTLEAWQRGETDVLVANIRAGGLGVDMTRARVAVYYSQTFSLGDYAQSLDRVHRPGQDQPVVYYHLIAESTRKLRGGGERPAELVDGRVYRALREKKKVVEAVLEGRREGGEEGGA